MESYIYFSYLSASLAYGLLVLLALSRKERAPTFIFAFLCSWLWCLIVAISAKDTPWFYTQTLAYETLRDTSWLILLSQRLCQLKNQTYQQLLTPLPAQCTVFFIALVFYGDTFPHAWPWRQHESGIEHRFASHIAISILGLILVEQLYRNTPLKQRHHLNYLCIGLGSLFAVDLLLFSKSLLFNNLDINLWQSRGIINILLTPLLVISLLTKPAAKASPASRKTIFYTTILSGCGIFLMLMAGYSFYLQAHHRAWGNGPQSLFTVFAVLLSVIPFTIGKAKAFSKAYLRKHFFHYSYDYREEWLKISKALAKLESLEELKGFIISTLTNLVDSTGGGLWLKNDQGQFFLAAEQNLKLTSQEIEYLRNVGDLPTYLANKQWVIDFFELAHAPEVYDDIDLSPWCYEDSEVWLIVPLFHLNRLEAFAVLTQARVPRKLNWEDHDLLKTVGMQLANALALSKASDELANHRQFETYHRLSAYLVHDLKNLVAQISLIVKNADKHKHNPDFFDDTIDTLNNVTKKMHQIVEQLKQGETKAPPTYSLVNLADIIQSIAQQHLGSPKPQIIMSNDECLIKANKIKLTSILTNLIQNAQDSTSPTNGWVKLVLSKNHDYAVLKIIDNGTGMDQQFIAERLFKPFDTTKGNAGMGIGAYEARDYIIKNAGSIRVDSQPGNGTTFTIQLPLAKQPSNSQGNNEPIQITTYR